VYAFEKKQKSLKVKLLKLRLTNQSQVVQRLAKLLLRQLRWRQFTIWAPK